MVSRGIESLRQNIVTRIADNLILILFILITPILIAGENQQVANMLPPCLKLLRISKIVSIVIKAIRKDMLDIISVSLGLSIHIDIEQGWVSHAHVDIRCESRKEMKHVAACELVQAETGNAVDRDIQLLQFTHQYFADRAAILIPNVTQNAEEHMFVGVPVDLPIVEDSDRSEVIYEPGNHPDLLGDGFFRIVIANSRDDQHHLIVQVAVGIIEYFFVARSKLFPVFFDPEVQIGHPGHLGHDQCAVILGL